MSHDIDSEKLTLTDHLDELRTRLIRAILYLALGMMIAWVFYKPIFHYLELPLQSVLKQSHGQIWIREVMSAFWISLILL